MSAIRLDTKYVEKPWGCDALPAPFDGDHGRRIGEVWFDGPAGRHPALLVKYIFTSERLSIQVHPDDAQGRARGLPGGKSECWLILDAQPGATLGMGTLDPLDGETLRSASLSGEIEQLMDWKPVSAGDFFYIPAGTVHAIGAGISLVVVQQNVDVTYRLYDYGRPRELHLDDGVAVSRARPYDRAPVNIGGEDEAHLLDDKEAPFNLDLMTLFEGAVSLGKGGAQSWFMPLDGVGTIDGAPWHKGQCWLLDGMATVDVSEGGRALLATL